MGHIKTIARAVAALALAAAFMVISFYFFDMFGDFGRNMKEALSLIPEETAAVAQPSASLAPEKTAGHRDDTSIRDDPPDPLEDACRVVKGSIRQGETFSHALRRARLNRSVSKTLIRALSTVLDFRRCRPGDSFAVGLDGSGGLVGCTYQKGPLEIYCMRQDASSPRGYRVYRGNVEVECRVMRLSGNIETSLFSAFSKAGTGRKITAAFCDIFSSRIDFNTEIQPGDEFDILYEEYFKDGEFIGYGKILAAHYKGQLLDLEAYYYRPEGAEVGAYFDPEGIELGTSFLRSPLPVYRLTSPFSKRRLHPILKIYRPHYGVDLAAPVGTPVMAVADGRVIFAGWRGEFGRTVILSHPGGIQTYYGHLYRFGRGIRRGVRVAQKQIIGYVGASGLATGPHLDYRIKIKGRFRNPFGIRFSPRSRLEGMEYRRFMQVYRRWAPFLHNGSKKEAIFVETKRLNDLPEGWIG